jgi:PAS domain-containing protein
MRRIRIERANVHVSRMNTAKRDFVQQVVAAFVADHFTDAVLVLDDEGRLLDCNRAAGELLGENPLRALASAIDAQGSWTEFVAHAREGSTSLRVAPEAEPGLALKVDAVTIDGHLVVTVRDALPERRREAELERVRRSDATGQLAMRIVHDMNNILTPILCMSTLLLAALDGGSPTSAYAREIEDAAQRAVDLAREMREFLQKSASGEPLRTREPDRSVETG